MDPQQDINENDIAIIGMSCRVAGANSPSELWDLLASSRDVQSEITRFNSSGYYHPNGGPRKGLTNVKHAYMLENDAVDKFDNQFFQFSALEAVAMDPQQRMLLETAYEAVENAGIQLSSFMGTDTAVYAGMDSCDYHLVLARDLDTTPRYLATGTAACMAANRLSYFFNLSGPSLTIDTACSSTMVALHQAVRALQCREIPMAVVCGAKLIINPDMFMPSSELGFLSPKGRCHSFDAAGDGYGRGEGVAAVLLKPLKTALLDGDPIRSVIKGTRVNQDGKTQGITLPSAEAQRRNMESLYKELNLSPDNIQYIEAHGTGTAAGDPLEFSAINAVFDPVKRGEPLVVGSVKSNVGHTESCAGLIAVIKTVVCLEKGMIPPQMHFNNPNPKISFQNVHVPVKLTEWPDPSHGNSRVAAINTFGAGGTNGHAVLVRSIALCESQVPDRPLLYKVSATDVSTVRRLSMMYADYVEVCKPNLYDLAYTTLSRRSDLKEMMFFTAKTHDEAIRKLKVESPRTYTKDLAPIESIIFLFTGQGAQSAQMGKTLIEQSPLFRAVLVECEDVLANLPDKPSWSIIEELLKPVKLSNVYQATFSQPLSTALQLGLICLWKYWGLVPTAVVGHSSGEIAAAYVAGFVSLRDAIIIAYYRGLYSGSASSNYLDGKPKGAMCAVSLSEKGAMQLIERFNGQVQLAAVNSRTSCTLSGDRTAIESIINICKQTGTFCRELRVDQAYHSHHMTEPAAEYTKALIKANVSWRDSPERCDMFSSVTGRKMTAEECTPSYWKNNMLSTVRFSTAVSQCIKYHPNISSMLEVGPHPALKGPAQEILRSLGKDSVTYFHSCVREKDDFETLLESAGAMIARGMSLKTPNLNAREIVDGLECTSKAGNVLTDLPCYTWNHSTRFWTESRTSNNLRYRKFPRHQLLGSRSGEDIPSCPSWRNFLMLKEVPWLLEIKTNGANVAPPTLFLFMALEAARQLQALAIPSSSSFLLSNVVFSNSLDFIKFIDHETVVELQFHARSIQEFNMYKFEIFSLTTKDQGDSSLHCSGEFSYTDNLFRSTDSMDIPLSHDQSLLDRFATLAKSNTFELSELQVSSTASTGTFEALPESHEHYFIDPAALDAILHLPPASLVGRNLPAVHRIASIRSMVVPANIQYGSSGNFSTEIQPIFPNGGQSNIRIKVAESLVLFSDVYYEVDHLLIPELALKSLFYKPVTLPDISKLKTSQPITLSRCIKLLSHKWPMCDIGVSGGSPDNIERLLAIFPGIVPGTRSGFRSIQILGKRAYRNSDRVRFVDKFPDDSQFHLLFVEDFGSAEDIGTKLHACGLLCTRSVKDESKISETYEKICEVKGLDQDNWTLWRINDRTDEVRSGYKTVLFACSNPNSVPIPSLSAALHIPLQPTAIRAFCQRSENEKFDAVVIDNFEKPIITTWSGSELVPWLQTLLSWANSVLWITQKVNLDPRHQLPNTLLRTLQSEQPALKVKWLVLETTETESYNQAIIQGAYSALLIGENEVKVEIKGFQTQILRYLPDDGLSVASGLMIPKELSIPIVDKDYELSLAARQEPVLLSYDLDPLKTNANVIQVESSVIDLFDLSAIHHGRRQYTQSGLGTFFAGRLLSKSYPKFHPLSRVVGWNHAAHRRRVEMRSQHTLLCEGNLPSDVAASTFAVLATALCIVDGHARARAGDSFRVHIDGILGDGITRICKEVGATVLGSAADGSPDFTVCLGSCGELSVNGSPVNIYKYLMSNHGWNRITQAWKDVMMLKSRVQSVGIADYRQALHITPEEAYSTVFKHADIEAVKQNVPIHTTFPNLFSADGIYIIIGGLGGLGRWVCSWMVSKGAKRLVVISRNGLQSEEARATFQAINTANTSLEVIKADACDRTAMADTLAQLRHVGDIKGVLNLAMLLGDAPLKDMEGWQWDRALRLKVDSSWILHEETLTDPLEFFILFSSIASVLGNRNQAGYNVGNTFLNALAEYRRSIGLTAISIALGAMTEIGVLHELGREDLTQTLSRGGLSHLGKSDLAKIMEAAVLESRRTERWLLLTGLEMFERVDGKLVGSQDQTQLYWTELPEFGHLQTHRLSNGGGTSDGQMSLRERLVALNGEDREKVHKALLDAFLEFFAKLLGFDTEMFNPGSSLFSYGLDSLSAVSCQYWFYRELSLDVTVSEVFNSSSIDHLVTLAAAKFDGA